MKHLIQLMALCALSLPAAVAAQAGRAGGFDPERVFNSLDKNHDGEISPDEIPDNRPGLKQAFGNIDRDGSGGLSREEFTAVLERAMSRGAGSGRSRRDQGTPPAPTPGSSTAPPSDQAPLAELPPARFGVQHYEAKLPPARSGRDITLSVYSPDGDGPFPVIVFSPDLAADDAGYAALLDGWAAQGYVILLPRPAATASSAAAGAGQALSHWRERPEDVAAVVDGLEALARSEARLQDKLDLDAVGVAGHLIGAMASSMLVGAEPTTHDSFADPRVKAALLLAPQGRGQILDEHAWEHIAAPMMVLTGSELGSKRTGKPASWRTEPYELSTSPDAYLVYVQHLDGRFGGLFPPGGGDYQGEVSPQLQSYAQQASLDFWNAFLKHDAASRAALDGHALAQLSQGIVQVETRQDAPSSAATAGYAPDAPAPYAYDVADSELTDPARARTLPIRVYAPRAPGDERFPTILFSHGLGESRDSYHYLGEALAAHGYVAVFVSHPGSDAESFQRSGYAGLNTVDNVREKTADLHFILDLLANDTLDDVLLRHRVDPERIAIGGQCAGTSMAALMAGLNVVLPGNEHFRSPDPHVKVIVLLGPQVPMELSQIGSNRIGQGLDMLKKNSWEQVTVPALVMAGERDFMWSETMRQHPRYRVIAYDDMASTEKYLFDLKGAAHQAFTDSTPWYPAGPRNPQHHVWIAEAVVAFLDGYLKGDAAAIQWLRAKALQDEAAGGLTEEYVSARPLGAAASAAAPAMAAPSASSSGPASASGDAVAAYYDAVPGPYTYAVLEHLSLHDDRRNKDLQLRVTYPQGAPGESFPVIVFSHGAWGSTEFYQPLMQHWASYGYVTVQMDHADSQALGVEPGDQSVFQHWSDRPGDISFTIDALPQIEAKLAPWSGHFDLTRIGVGGHSFGAHTAQLVGGAEFNGAASFKDPRARAILMMSPQGIGQGLDAHAWDDFVLPMMVVTGSNDIGRNAQGVSWRIDPFRYARSQDKYLLFVMGAYHDFGGATGGRVRAGSPSHDDPQIEREVLGATTAFWDASLKDAPDAKAFLASGELQHLSNGQAVLTENPDDVAGILKRAPPVEYHGARSGRD